jgi:hypothetical protein
MLRWLVSDGVSYTCSDGWITDAPVVRKYLCTLVGALYLYHWCLLLRVVELHTQEYWRCEILGVNIVDSVEDDADTIVVPVHPIIASASAGGQQWNEKWVQCHPSSIKAKVNSLRASLALSLPTLHVNEGRGKEKEVLKCFCPSRWAKTQDKGIHRLCFSNFRKTFFLAA